MGGSDVGGCAGAQQPGLPSPGPVWPQHCCRFCLPTTCQKPTLTLKRGTIPGAPWWSGDSMRSFQIEGLGKDDDEGAPVTLHQWVRGPVLSHHRPRGDRQVLRMGVGSPNPMLLPVPFSVVLEKALLTATVSRSTRELDLISERDAATGLCPWISLVQHTHHRLDTAGPTEEQKGRLAPGALRTRP